MFQEILEDPLLFFGVKISHIQGRQLEILPLLPQIDESTLNVWFFSVDLNIHLIFSNVGSVAAVSSLPVKTVFGLFYVSLSLVSQSSQV
jgi:hypothetical protein